MFYFPLTVTASEFLSRPHKVSHTSQRLHHDHKFCLLGHDQSDLAQYSTSLVSSTSHIAHINITDNSLRGEWKVIIQSQGTYTFQALGSSGLRFSEVLFNIDTSSRHGFKKIDGRPTQGN